MFFGARYFGQRYFGARYWGTGADEPPIITGGGVAYSNFRRKSELKHVAKYAHLLARELEEKVIKAVENETVTSRASLRELLVDLRRESAPKVRSKSDLTPIFRMIESSAIAALRQQEEDEDDLLLLAS